jgi:hypothetical protein
VPLIFNQETVILEDRYSFAKEYSTLLTKRQIEVA